MLKRKNNINLIHALQVDTITCSNPSVKIIGGEYSLYITDICDII